MKKLSLIFICLLSVLNINAAINSGSCGDNARYTLDTETGVLSITGTGAMTNYGYPNYAPWDTQRSYIKTIKIADGVTSIGNYAFWFCSSLTSMAIPNSVTSIGDWAFYWCSSLTSVTIPNSVKSIGEDAFSSCYGLTSITIPNSVTTIGDEAFGYCKTLTSILVEKGNAKFDSRNNCNAIIETASNTLIAGCKNTVIPNDVTSIGKYAFCGCSGLTSVTIPNSVTSIGAYAFDGTGWYNNQPDGLVYVEKFAYKYKGTMPANTNITIKEGTKGIAGGAFFNCSNLTSVIIPNSVTSIGDGAFISCTGLTSVHITDIAAWCKINFGSNSNPLSYAKHLFMNGKEITDLVIPNSVTSIGNSVFSGCSGLTSITIPNSVTSIGRNAFEGCSSLEELLYFSKTPPKNWVATKNTYVPDTKTYSSPSESINGKGIFPMISFELSSFNYTGLSPEQKWSNNVKGYDAVLSFPDLSKNAGNYEEWIPATFTKGELSFSTNVVCRYTIKPAPLTVKATNLSRQYGDENPNLSIEYTGFVNSETEEALTKKPMISTTAELASPVGNYPITVSGGEALNYDITYQQGELLVTGVSITAKVKNVTKVYGDENPDFIIEYSGLKNGETVPAWTTAPTFQTDATKNSGVGEYAIKAVGGAAKNYDISFTDGVLTITQAPLTIKASDASRKYFEEEPSFEYTCTGFLNGDDEDVFTKKPTLVTDATKTSNVGKYKITPSGAEAKNYEMSYLQGILTINIKEASFLTIDDIATVGYNGKAQTPDITVRDGTTILNGETDYDVTYNNNISVGTANVTITCKGNYIGTINKTFIIEDVITFADTNVKAICIANWDINGSGELSEEEAAAVTSLGNVFQGANITSFDELRYFTGITSIPASAFNGCSSLISIKIPNTVTSIGSSAFMGCSKLTSVTIPNGVTTIESETFYNCSSMTSVTIPNNVTSIGNYAFYGTNLCTLIVGTGVSSIGSNVFTNRPIKTIWLSNTPPQGYTNAQGTVNYVINSQYCSLSNIKEYKFLSSMFDVDGVIYVPVSPSERTCDAIDCLFDGLTKEAIINATVSYKNIDMKVLNVMPYTFCQGTTLQKADLDFYGNIEKNIFYGCKDLETVVIGQNVTGIGENAFNGFSNLQNVNIGNGVTDIGNCAFSGCSSLKNFSFGTQVQTIGKEAFSDCISVTAISSKAQTPPVCGSMALDGINKWECKLYVPEGHVSDYQEADQWKEFFFIEEGDIPEYILGDVNGDGVVNGTDIQAVINVIVDGEYDEKADVNSDGVVNGTDIQEVINIIVNAE